MARGSNDKAGKTANDLLYGRRRKIGDGPSDVQTFTSATLVASINNSLLNIELQRLIERPPRWNDEFGFCAWDCENGDSQHPWWIKHRINTIHIELTDIQRSLVRYDTTFRFRFLKQTLLEAVLILDIELCWDMSSTAPQLRDKIKIPEARLRMGASPPEDVHFKDTNLKTVMDTCQEYYDDPLELPDVLEDCIDMAYNEIYRAQIEKLPKNFVTT